MLLKVIDYDFVFVFHTYQYRVPFLDLL